MRTFIISLSSVLFCYSSLVDAASNHTPANNQPRQQTPTTQPTSTPFEIDTKYEIVAVDGYRNNNSYNNPGFPLRNSNDSYRNENYPRGNNQNYNQKGYYNQQNANYNQQGSNYNQEPSRNNSPRSNSRWYKDSESRKAFLRGDPDYNRY